MGIMPWSKGLSALEQEELRQREVQRAAQQLSNQQQYQHYVTSNSTASNAFNVGMASGSITTTGTQGLFGGTLYNTYSNIERLEKLEPGWVYVRWRKREDHEAEAWAVPIIALAVVGGRVEYQLAGAKVQAQSEVQPAEFLGIVTPRDAYDTEYWNEKARAAYYDWHAADVAAKLLKSAAGVKV